jgi:glycosyltransferase involved in cell wall biosynthesis
MRILLTTDPVGGVWTFTRELAQQLLRLENAVALVSLGRELSDAQCGWAEQMCAAYPTAFRFSASLAPLEWMMHNSVAYEAGAVGVMEAVEDFRPEVIHSSQFCFGDLPTPIPKVVTAHSDVLSWAAACRPAGLEASAWLDRYRELVQGGLDEADAVVAPTRWMASALQEHFRVRRGVGVVANGRTLLAPASPPNRSMQAVTAGRIWDDAKGLEQLAKLRSAVPVVIAGDNAFEGSSAENVTTLGHLDEQELLGLFAQSAVYLACSLYEPFGLTPLEAALCGCALVVRDIPTFREIWGPAAIYFHDDRSLNAALDALADDPENCKRAQQAAVERARFFTAERMAYNYLALYHEVIRGRQEFVSDAA